MEMDGGSGGGLRSRAGVAAAAVKHAADERRRRRKDCNASSSYSRRRALSAALGSPRCSRVASLAARWFPHVVGRPAVHSAASPDISMWWDTAVGGACGGVCSGRDQSGSGGGRRRGGHQSGPGPSFYTYSGPCLHIDWSRTVYSDTAPRGVGPTYLLSDALRAGFMCACESEES